MRAQLSQRYESRVVCLCSLALHSNSHTINMFWSPNDVLVSVKRRFIFYTLSTHRAATSSGKTGEWSSVRSNSRSKRENKIKQKRRTTATATATAEKWATNRMERITSRDSVSVCAKKSIKQFVIRKTHTDFQFELAPENWILCARHNTYHTQASLCTLYNVLCVCCICTST